MTTPPDLPLPARPALRASDAERDAVAARLRTAAAAGRLTMPEVDERQAAAYAAVTREELAPLTADLPDDAPPAPPAEARSRNAPLTVAARRRLAAHAIVVGVLAVFLVTRWTVGPEPWFWPAWPLLWLGLSLVLHRRWAPRVTDPTAAAARV